MFFKFDAICRSIEGKIWYIEQTSPSDPQMWQSSWGDFVNRVRGLGTDYIYFKVSVKEGPNYRSSRSVSESLPFYWRNDDTVFAGVWGAGYTRALVFVHNRPYYWEVPRYFINMLVTLFTELEGDVPLYWANNVGTWLDHKCPSYMGTRRPMLMRSIF